MPTRPTTGAPSPYGAVLQDHVSGAVCRHLCVDQDGLADTLAAALRSHAAAPPSAAPALTAVLQGNLSEFGAWDLGERHWLLFERQMTWTANAESPWKGSSTDGIDILALPSQRDLALLVVEVKSSEGGGANLVSGEGSTLQSDFSRLFDGAVQGRLFVSVGQVLSDLRFHRNRPDLEGHVKALVGTSPAECGGLRLVGVLLCNRGTQTDEQARDRAFARLTARLTALGWHAAQLAFRTVEVTSVQAMLTRTVNEATR